MLAATTARVFSAPVLAAAPPAPPPAAAPDPAAGVPEVVFDKRLDSEGNVKEIRSYQRGRLLGKGGFARCFKFLNREKNRTLAGKVVDKETLNKAKAKSKLLAEIKIHRSVSHQYIVGFESFFEDNLNVYMMLEVCPNQTLMELVKRRRRLTECEAALYSLQLLDAMRYLHANSIIHRDLKLGNLFLSSDMGIRVGDFGLATMVTYGGERKKTVCGTPNYIAPEILDGGQSGGHSFEVDIWAFGVILYTLVVGKPPFETTDVKSTYKKIRENNYSFPPELPLTDDVKDLVGRILVPNPFHRPTLDQIASHPFFTAPHVLIPTSLPLTALASAPVFTHDKLQSGSSMVRALLSKPTGGLLVREPHTGRRIQAPNPAPLPQPPPAPPSGAAVSAAAEERENCENAPPPAVQSAAGSCPGNRPSTASAGAAPRAALSALGSGAANTLGRSQAPPPPGTKYSSALGGYGDSGPPPPPLPQAAPSSNKNNNNIALWDDNSNPTNLLTSGSSGLLDNGLSRLSLKEQQQQQQQQQQQGQGARGANFGGQTTLPTSSRTLSAEGNGWVDKENYGTAGRSTLKTTTTTTTTIATVLQQRPSSYPSLQISGSVSSSTSASLGGVSEGGATAGAISGGGGESPHPNDVALYWQSRNSSSKNTTSGSSGFESAAASTKPSPANTPWLLTSPALGAGGGAGSTDASGFTTTTTTAAATVPVSSPKQEGPLLQARAPAVITSTTLPTLTATLSTTSLDRPRVVHPPFNGTREGSSILGTTAPATTLGTTINHPVATTGTAALNDTLRSLYENLSQAPTSSGFTSSASTAGGLRAVGQGNSGGVPPPLLPARLSTKTFPGLLSQQQPYHSSSTQGSSSHAHAPASNLGEAPPSVWVTTWVDYSAKYGLGYLLSNGVVGVYFNDSTKVVLESGGERFQYLERQSQAPGAQPYTCGIPGANTFKGEEDGLVRIVASLTAYPPELKKKVTLLRHFREFLLAQHAKRCGSGNGSSLSESQTPPSGSGSHLFASSVASAGGGAALCTVLVPVSEEERWCMTEGSREAGASAFVSREPLPMVKKWVRSRRAVLFRLSTGAGVQVSFYDGWSLIFSPQGSSSALGSSPASAAGSKVTVLDPLGRRSVFSTQNFLTAAAAAASAASGGGNWGGHVNILHSALASSGVGSMEKLEDLAARIKYAKDILHQVVMVGGGGGNPTSPSPHA